MGEREEGGEDRRELEEGERGSRMVEQRKVREEGVGGRERKRASSRSGR